MSAHELREILARLEEQLETAELNDETEQMLTELRSHIDHTLDEAKQESESPMFRTAKALEAQFAAEHPTAERVIRELLDTLVRMGV